MTATFLPPLLHAMRTIPDGCDCHHQSQQFSQLCVVQSYEEVHLTTEQQDSLRVDID